LLSPQVLVVKLGSELPLIGVSASPDRPDNPGHLVGYGHRGLVVNVRGGQLGSPLT